jgi:uncharacterized protein YlaI
VTAPARMPHRGICPKVGRHLLICAATEAIDGVSLRSKILSDNNAKDWRMSEARSRVGQMTHEQIEDIHQLLPSRQWRCWTLFCFASLNNSNTNGLPVFPVICEECDWRAHDRSARLRL